MELKVAICQRRSVREYTDRSLDKTTVMALIEASVYAPSAINVQPWAFVVIQDKVLLKRYSDRAKILVAKTMDLSAAPAEFKIMLSDPAFNIFYNAGALIVICAKPVGQHPDWDCCLAAQNLMLTAHSMGLGSCPIGFAWSLLEQPDVKVELKIPPDFVPVLPVIVGYPSKSPAATERKKPEILSWM